MKNQGEPSPSDRGVGTVALGVFTVALFLSLLINAATATGGRLSVSLNSPQAVALLVAADR